MKISENELSWYTILIIIDFPHKTFCTLILFCILISNEIFKGKFDFL